MQVLRTVQVLPVVASPLLAHQTLLVPALLLLLRIVRVERAPAGRRSRRCRRRRCRRRRRIVVGRRCGEPVAGEDQQQTEQRDDQHTDVVDASPRPRGFHDVVVVGCGDAVASMLWRLLMIGIDVRRRTAHTTTIRVETVSLLLALPVGLCGTDDDDES